MNDDTRARIRELCGRYPTKRAALLPSLWAVQEGAGWISRDDIAETARLLGLAPADVEGVASFYLLFAREPVGRVVIDVCDSIVCGANGAEQLLADICARLGVQAGGTTADGRYTVRRAECIAACHQAPAIQVDLVHRGPIRDAAEALA